MSTKKLTQEQFIIRCKEIHGTKYNYSNTTYVNSVTKICVQCNICHTIWSVTPGNHTGPKKSGCPVCKIKTRKLINNAIFNTAWFIKKSIKVHGNRYDYSITDYTTSNQKVKILCNKHGEFEQWPQDHMHGTGCSHCSGSIVLHTNFIEEMVSKHTKFNFDKFVYCDSVTKSIVICADHGEFLQTPSGLKSAKPNCGCRQCGIEKSLKHKIATGIIRDPTNITEYELYRKSVWDITNKEFYKHYHKINPNNIKRGLQNHLDHKYSIQQGWHNNIPAEVIGSWVNLRILPHRENRSKSNRCLYTQEELLKYYDLSLSTESFIIDNQIVSTIELPKVPHKKRTQEQKDAQSLRQTGKKLSKHSAEANAAKSERMRGRKLPGTQKPVICGGIEFLSAKHAAEHFFVDITTVYNRINSNRFPDWSRS